MDRGYLEVSDLHAFYGASHALHGVHLRAARGELVALLGRNGAGKTTTLSSLAGIIPKTRGSILIDGEEMMAHSSFQRVRHGLMLVPSGARAFWNLTVEENLEIVRSRELAADEKAWTIERVHEFFPKLHDLRDSMAGNLSGGERQMLAIGRGLMANPKILLLDEPSEGLAPIVLQQIGGLIAQLKEAGLTMLLAEQNHRFALRHADRAFLIEKGQVCDEGTRDELEERGAFQRYLGVGV